MPTPPVEGTPLVLYWGPDSDAVGDRWETGERPFALRGFDPDGDVAAALDRHAVDCVVCHADGDADLRRMVERVRAASDRVPVVAFDGDGSLGSAAAVESDVTQYVQVGDGFDPVQRVAALGPLVERTRERRRSRSMLDSLLANIPLSVYFKDRAGRHVRVSDALTGLSEPSYLQAPDGKRHHAAADVVGKTDHDLYPASLAADTVRDDQRVVDSEEPIDERIERSTGGELDGTYLATSKAPWYDDRGEVRGVVGVTRDITDRQQYEKQLERQNERLQRFASVLSHDLRNPLEVALGRLEFARETGDPEHFEAIENALDRMDALVDDVLTLARQGETVSDPERVDLSEAVADAWAVVDTSEATLVVDTEATVLADPGRLRQLLENVFRNAVEHGGADVTVTVGDLSEPPGFFVADDGPGIPPADRESVFDSGVSTGEDGTGLGLSIVRTIAEAHGWDVSATEGAESGARFEFTQVQRVSR